jgi:hypothetical protein
VVGEAADAIDAAGSAGDYVRVVARRERQLWQLEQGAPRSLAQEIALNDDAERRLLRPEALAIEKQWRRKSASPPSPDREPVFFPRDAAGSAE